MRAIAVMAVLLFHAGLPALEGGYVGVDLFYVLSGFLITGLLLREAERTGSIDFLDFYARRLKRLAPVYLTVLALTLGFMVCFLSPLYVARFTPDLVGAALYVANVVFAGRTTGYFAEGTDPSPVLHFWSLAVEEQFYLVWPLLVFLVLRWGRRHLPRAEGVLHRRVGLLMAGIVVVSFILAVALTPRFPTPSFYLLHTRAWELGVGALLACLPRLGGSLTERARTVLLAVGSLAVVGSVLLYDAATPFPSWPALAPVLGSAAMLVAGNGATCRLSRLLLENRVMVWLGDISYSLYLWHWPVLVLPAALAGMPLGMGANLALAALSILLAWLSHVTLEEGFQHMTVDGLRTLVFTTSLVLSVALVLVANGSATAARRALADQTTSTRIPALEERLQRVPSARLATYANESVSATGEIIVPEHLTPSLDALEADLSAVQTNGCSGNREAAATARCWGGDPAADKVLVLLGDSHASHWWPAFDAIGRKDHYRVLALTRNACTVNDLGEVPSDLSEAHATQCAAFRQAAGAAIQELDPDVVVVAQTINQYFAFSPDQGGFTDRWQGSIRTALAGLPDRSRLLYLGDSPSYSAQQSEMPPAGSCLTRHVDDPQQCRIPSRVPEVARAEASSRQAVEDLGGRYVDLSAILCTEQQCPMSTLNNVLYRDYTHVTSATARILQPVLADELDRTPKR